MAEPDPLVPLRGWARLRDRLPQERADRLATAWRRGARNINRLAEAAGVDRNTIYSDLRNRGIDPTDRQAPVEPAVGTTDAYTHLVDSQVLVQTTGTATVTCTLRAPRSAEIEHHVLDLGSGVEVLVHPDHIRHISEPEFGPRSADGQHHFLSDYQNQITDTDKRDSRAVHEAAHAVVGMIAGMTVEAAWVGTDHAADVGGEVSFLAPWDTHLFALQLTAGPVAHAKRIGELGYDDLTQAAVEVLGGQGDHACIQDYMSRWWVIWRSQAQRDVDVLIHTPAVWQAITTVATALIERNRLTDADIRALIGDPGHLCTHQVWHPNLL